MLDLPTHENFAITVFSFDLRTHCFALSTPLSGHLFTVEAIVYFWTSVKCSRDLRQWLHLLTLSMPMSC